MKPGFDFTENDRYMTRKRSVDMNSRVSGVSHKSKRAKSYVGSHVSKKSNLSQAGQSLVTGVTKATTISNLKKQLDNERQARVKIT